MRLICVDRGQSHNILEFMHYFAVIALQIKAAAHRIAPSNQSLLP